MPPLLGINFVEMARLQQICPEVAALCTSSSLVATTVPAADIRLFGDVSTGVLRPLVPVPIRRAVFDALHSVGHPGMRATRRLVSLHFVWCGIAAQVY